MLVAYRTTVSFRGGCIYKRVDVTAIKSTRLYIQRPQKEIVVRYAANIL